MENKIALIGPGYVGLPLAVEFGKKIETKHEYDITPIDAPAKGKYDAIILAVSHNEFKEMGAEQLKSPGKESHVLYDIKYILNADEVDGRL